MGFDITGFSFVLHDGNLDLSKHLSLCALTNFLWSFLTVVSCFLLFVKSDVADLSLFVGDFGICISDDTDIVSTCAIVSNVRSSVGFDTTGNSLKKKKRIKRFRTIREGGGKEKKERGKGLYLLNPSDSLHLLLSRFDRSNRLDFSFCSASVSYRWPSCKIQTTIIPYNKTILHLRIRLFVCNLKLLLILRYFRIFHDSIFRTVRKFKIDYSPLHKKLTTQKTEIR